MTTTRALLLILAGLAPTPAAVQASPEKSYDFRVFLDEDEIGHHRFEVLPSDTGTLVTSEARFEVDFLFFTAYRYRHESNEVWEGACLRAIQASTNDNGDELFVRGRYQGSKLTLETPTGTDQVDGCVGTFAYWDPALLSRGRLLNAQTGELVPVELVALGEETITVRDEPTRARRFRISNPQLSIDVWYASNDEWVALESRTESGARLRYRIQ